MQEYIVGFRKYGVKLDVPNNSSREDLLNAFFAHFNGPQGVIDYLVRYMVFTKDDTQDAVIIEEKPIEQVKTKTKNKKKKKK